MADLLAEEIEKYPDFRRDPTVTGIERVKFDRWQGPLGKDPNEPALLFMLRA